MNIIMSKSLWRFLSYRYLMIRYISADFLFYIGPCWLLLINRIKRIFDHLKVLFGFSLWAYTYGLYSNKTSSLIYMDKHIENWVLFEAETSDCRCISQACDLITANCKEPWKSKMKHSISMSLICMVLCNWQ